MSWSRPRAALAALIPLTLLGLALAFLDPLASRGLTATYYYVAEEDPSAPWPDENDEVVVAVTETSLSYLNQHRAFSRYESNWDYTRHPIPMESPPFDVVLRGTITLDRARFLRARTPNFAAIEIDGRPLDDEPVSRGQHEIAIRWHGVFGDPHEQRNDSGLIIEWSEARSVWDEVPVSAVESTASWPELRRELWAAIACFALLLGPGVFLALRSRGFAIRKRRVSRLTTATVFAFGLLLRVVGYDVTPHPGVTVDEYFAAWNGYQILEDGTTLGWTTFPAAYHTRSVDLVPKKMWGRRFIVVTPYLEHPPAMHILVGAAAHLGGARHWSEVKHVHFRLVPIALNAIALWLVIAVGRRLFPRGPAPWLAGLVYAVLPLVCLQARLAKEEALVATLGLFSTYLCLRWKDGGERAWMAVAIGLTAGLAGFAKVPGFAFVLAACFLVARRRFLQSLLVLAGGLAVFGLFYAYGRSIGGPAFDEITALQSAVRHGHWNVFTKYFFNGMITHNAVGSGWLLFLWFAFFLAAARKPVDAIVAPTVIYLLTLVIAAASWYFGWYSFPILSYLALGAGAYLADLYERPDLLRALPLLAFGVAHGLNFTIPFSEIGTGGPLGAQTPLLVAAMIFAFGVYALTHATPAKLIVRVARLVTVAGILALIVLSSRFILNYDRYYQEYYRFDVTRAVR